MAGLANFIPEVYSKLLLMDRDKETVFSKLCNRNYSGEITQMGDRVHFTGLQKPTIQTYTKGLALTTEYLEDNTVEMVIDQAKYFNVLLDDMDKKQAAGDVTPETIKQARLGLADTLDQYIARLYSQAGTSVTETEVDSTSIISTLASGMTKLYKNNVPTSAEIYCVVSPEVAEKIMIADIVHNTDNSGTLTNGWIGRTKRFINLSIYMSVNVYSPSTVDYCMMFTKDAIALAEQVPVGTLEKFRSPTTLADVVRGFHLYGAKVIKPKELVALNLTTKAETTV